MGSVDDFKTAVKGQLAASGALSRMQASIRAQIVNALDDSHRKAGSPKQCPETYMVNELIRCGTAQMQLCPMR
jgi:hypothetical protein